MTVTYTSEVATSRGLSCFLKLLARWRGSVYKLVYLDLVIFLVLYYTLNLTYRFILTASGKELFESIVEYCGVSNNYIPLSFVLGFYVSLVMTRWWGQYSAIPFPDPIAVYVSATVHGQDERGRLMRRTIMRYVCLCFTMLFINISPRVKRRFPTLDHLVKAGLLLENEKGVIDRLNKKFPTYSKHWISLVWASSIITRARKEGRIRDDFAVKTMLDEINIFRGKCGSLINYDRISIPLVYTQVVTLAVYSYFLTTILGHQWVDGHKYKFELYFPIFTLLQFFFYMGWLKVAETLINPFGDDDDDFELNWMIDRHLQMSYLIVDEMHHEHPELIKDQYWDTILPEELPYTPGSLKESHPLPSTANIANTYQMHLGHSPPKFDDYLGSNPFIFTARPRLGSQHSVNNRNKSRSVTNLFKKLMRSDSTGPESTHEMLREVPKHVIEDIMEEVDEQLTVMSRRDEPARPSVRDIFKKSPTINIPEAKSSDHDFFDGFSHHGPYENVSNFPSPDEEPSDPFEDLKEKRERERLVKLKQNLTTYLHNDEN